MNSPSTSMVASMGIGGLLISGVGAASMYAMEKKKPTLKSTLRDFIIGAILVLFVLQLLPDSAQTIVDTFGGGIGSLLNTVMESASAATPSDMEIQVGVPKF